MCCSRVAPCPRGTQAAGAKEQRTVCGQAWLWLKAVAVARRDTRGAARCLCRHFSGMSRPQGLVPRQQLCWHFAEGWSSPGLGPWPGCRLLSGVDWEQGRQVSGSGFL